MLMVGLVFWKVIVELLFVLVVVLRGWRGRCRVSTVQSRVGQRGKRLIFLS